MRILFTSVSAHGHLLPLVPLMSAALDDGHDVGVVVSDGLASTVHDELPDGVEFLPAGPMPLDLATEAARRTGGDVMHPTVEGIGETFGGVLLDFSLDAALPAARSWEPDVVVAEMFNTVGGVIAAALDIPWYRVKLSVALPPAWVTAIDDAARTRYDRLSLIPTPPAATLDLWPASMRGQVDDAYPGTAVRSLRATAHRRPDAAPTTPDGRTTRILVTLGTIFSDADTLRAVVDEVAANAPDAQITATLGLLLGAGGTAAAPSDPSDRVRYVPFVPIDELLDGVDVVVTVGGAGTVLATLSRGVPMVVWPQGADQPAIAERVGAVGAGVVVGDSAAIGAAVRTVLGDPGYRAAARGVARELAAADDPHTVVRDVLTNGVPGAVTTTPS